MPHICARRRAVTKIADLHPLLNDPIALARQAIEVGKVFINEDAREALWIF